MRSTLVRCLGRGGVRGAAGQGGVVGEPSQCVLPVWAWHANGRCGGGGGDGGEGGEGGGAAARLLHSRGDVGGPKAGVHTPPPVLCRPLQHLGTLQDFYHSAARSAAEEVSRELKQSLLSQILAVVAPRPGVRRVTVYRFVSLLFCGCPCDCARTPPHAYPPPLPPPPIRILSSSAATLRQRGRGAGVLTRHRCCR